MSTPCLVRQILRMAHARDQYLHSLTSLTPLLYLIFCVAWRVVLLDIGRAVCDIVLGNLLPMAVSQSSLVQLAMGLEYIDASKVAFGVR